MKIIHGRSGTPWSSATFLDRDRNWPLLFSLWSESGALFLSVERERAFLIVERERHTIFEKRCPRLLKIVGYFDQYTSRPPPQSYLKCFSDDFEQKKDLYNFFGIYTISFVFLLFCPYCAKKNWYEKKY